MKKIATTAFSLLFSMAVMAQSYTFKVLGSKGDNKLDGTPMKVGTQLNDNQTLVVGSGAYVSLVHKNGKTLEIKNAGTFKVSDLVAKVGSSANLASKYAQFVASELSQGEDAAAARNRSQHMKKTGSVDRGLGLARVFLPKSSKLYGGQLALKWELKESKEAATVTAYRIYGYDISDQLIEKFDVNTNTAIIDLNKDAYAKIGDNFYKFKVVALDANGKEVGEPVSTIDGNAVQRLTDSELESVQQELASITGEEASALNKLIEARFFEEKELYANAILSYEKAIELSNNLDSYKKMYDEFLYRNVFTNEAAKDFSSKDKSSDK